MVERRTVNPCVTGSSPVTTSIFEVAMKTKSNKSVEEIVSKLFENGNSPTKVFGIDSELIIEVERKNPHIANHNSMRNEGLK